MLLDVSKEEIIDSTRERRSFYSYSLSRLPRPGCLETGCADPEERGFDPGHGGRIFSMEAKIQGRTVRFQCTLNRPKWLQISQATRYGLPHNNIVFFFFFLARKTRSNYFYLHAWHSGTFLCFLLNVREHSQNFKSLEIIRDTESVHVPCSGL